jgi:hypothetical protein
MCYCFLLVSHDMEIPSLVPWANNGHCVRKKERKQRTEIHNLLLKVSGSPFLVEMSLKYKDVFLITEKKESNYYNCIRVVSFIIYTASHSCVLILQKPHSAEAISGNFESEKYFVFDTCNRKTK